MRQYTVLHYQSYILLYLSSDIEALTVPQCSPVQCSRTSRSSMTGSRYLRSVVSSILQGCQDATILDSHIGNIFIKL